MNPTYDGVKYYSDLDWSVGSELERAEPIIKAFDSTKVPSDINYVIELYNIDRLLNIGVSLQKWGPGQLEEYKAIMQPIKGIIGRFFSKINDYNFVELYEQVSISYLDDFWTLFVQYKAYKRVSKDVFFQFLIRPDITLDRILSHKELVIEYDAQLAEVLRHSDQTPHLLSESFLENSKEKYHFPKQLSPNEYEAIFQKYIDSGNASPRMLQLLMNAQSTAECPVSDKLRLSAKRANRAILNNPQPHQIVQHIEQGVQISFIDQPEIITYEQDGFTSHLSYDVKWLKEHLDYPTVLNNFIYVFGMFDLCFRSTLVSVKSKISALEDSFSVKGIHDYPHGSHYQHTELISMAQMHSYYYFLLDQGVHLEDVFVWFFESYLQEEFKITGFRMKAASPTTTLVEKCRTLSSEMDGILKQFRMYATDGVIDRELFEMSSEHLIIDTTPSLISNKYLYASGEDIEKEMYALFSDQSLLSFTERTQSRYPTLYELLLNVSVSIDEFKPYQINGINWLVKRGSVTIDNENMVQLVVPRVFVLKDLYDHDVLCPNYLKPFEAELKRMIECGDLQEKSTLFSIPEADYLNYQLNKSKFSNGKDLRNKYVHSTYPEDEQEQQQDYIELLKIMVLVITKINEEFCLLADDQKEEGEV